MIHPLHRATMSTTLRPATITPADLCGLDVVADVEGWHRTWWGGCVHRKRRRYPFHEQSDLWVLVITEPPSQAGKRWRKTQALVGRLPDWAQERTP